MKKRCLSLFLALVLIISMLPMSAFAETVVQDSELVQTEEKQVNNTEKVEETLSVDNQQKDTLDEKADETLKEDTEQAEDKSAEEESDDVSHRSPRVWVIVEGVRRHHYSNVNQAWSSALDYSNLNVTIFFESSLQPYYIYSRLEGKPRTGSLTIDLNGNTLQRWSYVGVHEGGIFSFIEGTSGNYTIKNGTITGGRTINNGGAIYVNSPELTLTLEDLYITGNNAGKNGGAIFYGRNYNSSLNIRNCEIYDNSANGLGGGIYSTKTTSTGNNALSLDKNVVVKDNGKDNLIMDYDESDVNQILLNNTFNEDSEIHLAFNNGQTGAFSEANLNVDKYKKCFIPESDEQEIQVDSEKRLCLAKKGGPTPPVPTEYAAKLTVTQNDQKTEYNYEKADDAWKDVYGQYKDNEVEMTLLKDWDRTEKVNFEARNQKLTLDLNNNKIIRQTQKEFVDGGEVLTFSASGHFVVENGTITGGKNLNDGGGISINTDQAEIELHGLAIQDNSTQKNGGGIWAKSYQNSNIKIENCEIQNNTSQTDGTYGDDVYFYKDATNAQALHLAGYVKIGHLGMQQSDGNLIDPKGITDTSKSEIHLAYNDRQTGAFTDKLENAQTMIQNKVFLSEDDDAQEVKADSEGRLCLAKKMPSNPQAKLEISGKEDEYYATANDAWKDANTTYKNDEVTMTLLKDWLINAPLAFEERDESNTLVLNLGSNRITKTGVGEVLAFKQDGNFTVKNGTITGGNSLSNGGGISINDTLAEITLEDLIISGNKCTGNGGGIYKGNGSAKLILKNCKINQSINVNTASGYGGGLYIEDSDQAQPVQLIGNVQIDGNKGKENRNNLTLSKSTQKLIDATGLNYTESALKIGIGFSDFSSGRFTTAFSSDDAARKFISKDGSSGFYSDNAKYTIQPTNKSLVMAEDCAAKLTVIQNGKQTTYTYEKADDAWKDVYGKYKNDEVEMTLYKSWTRNDRIVFDQRDQKLTLDLNNFQIIRLFSDERMIKDGEVLSFAKTGNFVVKNGTITGGKSLSYGGGIAINGESNIQILLENLNITGNQSYWGGGIFFAPGQAQLTVKNCDISGNSATINGGGVYVSNSDQSNPMKFEGKVKIKDNSTNTIANNLVFCYENEKSHLIDANGLTADSDIGVKFNTFNVNEFRFFTTNFNSKDAIFYFGYFKSEDQRAQLIVEKNALALQRISSCVATLTVDGNIIPYENPAQAWYDANDQDKYLNHTVTMTLYQDWDATNEYFGDGPGMGSGRFIPSKRSEENILILDLNGFTINRQVKKSKEYGNLFSFQNEGHVIIKNGTLTGGRNSKHGGCIFFGNIPKGQSSSKQNVELINLTIRNNYSDAFGGGIYIDNNLGVHLTIKDCLITDNDIGKERGAGIYVPNGTCPDLKLVGRTQIYRNDDNTSPDLFFGIGARMEIPELTEGAYVNIAAVLSGSLIHKGGVDARFIQGGKNDKGRIGSQLKYLHPAWAGQYIHMHENDYGYYVLLANWPVNDGEDESIIEPQQDVKTSTSVNTGIANDSGTFIWISAFVVLAMCGSVELVNRKRRREKNNR